MKFSTGLKTALRASPFVFLPAGGFLAGHFTNNRSALSAEEKSNLDQEINRIKEERNDYANKWNCISHLTESTKSEQGETATITYHKVTLDNCIKTRQMSPEN